MALQPRFTPVVTAFQGGLNRRHEQVGRRFPIGRFATGLALAMAVATPAHAQFSDSYKFLESVRKKEGDKVVDALSVPGTTVINTKDSSTGQTALHIMTQQRDTTWMRYLIAKGANVNARDFKGITPLEIAVGLGFVEGAQVLIGSGAHVDEADATGETPLISAVHRRDALLARVLLQAGANPDRPDNSGRSARDYVKADGASNPVAQEIEKAKSVKAGAGKKYGPSI